MATRKATPKSTTASRKLFAPVKPRAEQPAVAVTSNESAPERPQRQHIAESAKVKVLLSWISPERVWKPKTQTWYLVSALVILLCILVAVKLEYYVFVVALLAFLLLWFVQGTMEPWMVKHQVTTEGIFTYNTFHRWDEITYFWFVEKDDWRILYLDFSMQSRQQRLNLLVPKGDDVELFNILIDHLKYGEMYEVGYNAFAQIIYGTYKPITDYIPDLDQPTKKELRAAN